MAAEHRTLQVACTRDRIRATISPTDRILIEAAILALTPTRDNTTRQSAPSRWVASERLDRMAVVINVARETFE